MVQVGKVEIDDQTQHRQRHGNGGEHRGYAVGAVDDGGVGAQRQGDGAVVVQDHAGGHLGDDGHEAQHRAGDDAAAHHWDRDLDEGGQAGSPQTQGRLLDGDWDLHHGRRGRTAGKRHPPDR